MFLQYCDWCPVKQRQVDEPREFLEKGNENW